MYLFQPLLNLLTVRAKSDLHSTMYLFQLCDVRPEDYADFNLHSTMYLFQLIGHAGFDVDSYHLHSTMYLFQLYRRFHLRYCNLHLHSTMYLFQRIDTVVYHYKKEFTFHYVSISTCFIMCMSEFLSIYIPLCIYFNHAPDRKSVV